ncbi:hypothetical protein ACTQW9_01650 [Lachnospiraceae bacterium LCP19S3_B12]
MKKYKCNKSFSVESYDADGFLIPNNERIIEEGEVYKLDESGSTLIGGEVHLDNSDGSWIEISKEHLFELFEIIECDEQCRKSVTNCELWDTRHCILHR